MSLLSDVSPRLSPRDDFEGFAVDDAQTVNSAHHIAVRAPRDLSIPLVMETAPVVCEAVIDATDDGTVKGVMYSMDRHVSFEISDTDRSLTESERAAIIRSDITTGV